MINDLLRRVAGCARLRRSCADRLAAAIMSAALLCLGSQAASAACSTTGPDPVILNCATTTTSNTTNLNPNNAATSDALQEFAADIRGTVASAAVVDGFVLKLKTDKVNGGVTMTNNGAVTTNQLTTALQLTGNGGLVTYSGTGTVSNTGTGTALALSNADPGGIMATITNAVNAGNGAGLTTATGTGSVQVTVTSTGSVTGNSVGGIQFNGGGINTLTNSGGLVQGVGANTIGVTATNVGVTNQAGGTITGDLAGILASGTVAIGSNTTGSTISGTGAGSSGVSAAIVTGSNDGTITGSINGILTTGGVNITSNSGTISGTGGVGTGISSGADVTIANAGNVTGTDTGINAITTANITNSGTISGANTFGVVANGDVTVHSNAGTISGGDRAIFSQTGNVTVTNLAGAMITGANEGIAAVGNTMVINSGTITGIGSDAIGGDTVTITNNQSGLIQGTAAGSIGVSGNTVMVTSNAGTISGEQIGISATTANVTNSGQITATAAAGSTATRGIVATDVTVMNSGTIAAAGGTAAASSIGIQSTTARITNMANGAISGALDGINTTDTTTVTNSGAISGTGRTGIRVGNATIMNFGTVTGATGIAFRGGGFGAAGSVFNAGTITGTGGTAINFAISPSTGPYSLTIAPGSVINGNVLGTGNDTFQLGGSGTGTFNVGTIGAALQYRGFAIFNKVDASTWTLTGSGAQNWTISQGTLIGDTNSLGGSLITDNAALVFSQGFDGTYAGVIAGTGSLAKLGTGALILTGISTYTGGTTVAAGTLAVDGAIVGSAVTVASGAVLGGRGTVGAVSALSGATIAPGAITPFGTLNVSGNVSFAAGSAFLVNINAAGQNDKLMANGQAVLQGGTVQVLAANGSYTPSTRYTLLTANGGVSGTFAQLSTSSNLAFLTPTLSYDANDVFLGFQQTVTPQGTPVTFPSVAVTRNQAASAAAVQALGLGNPVFNAVLGQSVTGARQAFDALSGEVHASAVSAGLADSGLPRDAILGRLSDTDEPLLGAARTMTGIYAADLPGRRPDLAPVELRLFSPRSFGVWGQGFGNFGRTSSDRNAASLERSTGGFILGADTIVASGWSGVWRFGIAGGYTNDSFEARARQSSGTFESVFGALYAGVRYGDLDLKSGLVLGTNSTSTHRRIQFPGFSDAAASSHGGLTAQAFGEAGYRFGLSGLDLRSFGLARAVLEPVIGAAAIHLHQDRFVETGGFAALTGVGRDYDLATTTVALRAEATLDTTLPLTARALLGWRHAFGDAKPSVLLAFQGGAQSFSVAGVPIDSDALIAEAGLDYSLSPTLTLGVAYSGQFGQRARDNAIKGNLEARF
ncbi:outer membrane autotransporter barrel domain-containing protein [Rhizobiales bacterium GAS188]|nr:outer membrane autotransporter barrel domain-containing protein [Rhizobiales bacterium GAS188]